jgi:hypothetical protein
MVMLAQERNEAREEARRATYDAAQETIKVSTVKSHWIEACRERDEAREAAERYRRKTLSQDAEIAKLKASSNENYWELSRQRDNMRFALHKIADSVRYGFKHGSKSGEEVK